MGKLSQVYVHSSLVLSVNIDVLSRHYLCCIIKSLVMCSITLSRCAKQTRTVSATPTSSLSLPNVPAATTPHIEEILRTDPLRVGPPRHPDLPNPHRDLDPLYVNMDTRVLHGVFIIIIMYFQVLIKSNDIFLKTALKCVYHMTRS